jgi:hypothetical protein
VPSSHVCGSEGLLTNAQLSDDIEISLWILTPHIVEQTSATANQTQQASPGGVILAVSPHVLGQPINPLGQDGNLHLRRAGIGVGFLMVADNLGFSLFRDRHSFFCFCYVVLHSHVWPVVYRCEGFTQRQISRPETGD